jgi:hypothetical protein
LKANRRLLVATALVLLAGCQKSFDERYADAQKKIDERAASIDKDLSDKASEAAMAPVQAAPTVGPSDGVGSPPPS